MELQDKIVVTQRRGGGGGEYKIVTRKGHEGLFWDASGVLFLDLGTVIEMESLNGNSLRCALLIFLLFSMYTSIKS